MRRDDGKERVLRAPAKRQFNATFRRCISCAPRQSQTSACPLVGCATADGTTALGRVADRPASAGKGPEAEWQKLAINAAKAVIVHAIAGAAGQSTNWGVTAECGYRLGATGSRFAPAPRRGQLSSARDRNFASPTERQRSSNSRPTNSDNHFHWGNSAGLYLSLHSKCLFTQLSD